MLENAEKIEGKEAVMKSSNKQLVDHLKKHEIDNTGNVEYEADLSVAISEYESSKWNHYIIRWESASSILKTPNLD